MSGTKIIAFAGKGGVGKTSLAALTVRLLTEAEPQAKILAIDADPAVGLSTALGVEVTHTLDDIRQRFIGSVEGGDTRAAIEILKARRTGPHRGGAGGGRAGVPGVRHPGAGGAVLSRVVPDAPPAGAPVCLCAGAAGAQAEQLAEIPGICPGPAQSRPGRGAGGHTAEPGGGGGDLLREGGLHPGYPSERRGCGEGCALPGAAAAAAGGFRTHPGHCGQP